MYWHIAKLCDEGVTGMMICVSVTRQQIELIRKSGSELCEKILALDNVKEVCYDDWYGPYIYCMVHRDDEQTLRGVSRLVEKFLEEGCNQQSNAINC